MKSALELLEEIEETVEAAPKWITGKVLVDAEDLLQIVREIRLALPDDVQQARWIVQEKKKILQDAQAEFEKLVREGEKQAEYLVENHDIAKKAEANAKIIISNAEGFAKQMKIDTFEYIDKVLFEMKENIDNIQAAHVIPMYNAMENQMENMQKRIDENREEIHALAGRVQGEIISYTKTEQEKMKNPFKKGNKTASMEDTYYSLDK